MNIPIEIERFLSSGLSASRQIDIGFEIFEFPDLGGVMKFQEGYRINGVTKERETSWPENWVVFGCSNSDPLIYNTDDGTVMFGRHGAGTWKPVTLFSSIAEMSACLVALSDVVLDADDHLYDADFNIKPRYVDAMKRAVSELMGDEQGNVIIESFEITSY